MRSDDAVISVDRRPLFSGAKRPTSVYPAQGAPIRQEVNDRRIAGPSIRVVESRQSLGQLLHLFGGMDNLRRSLLGIPDG